MTEPRKQDATELTLGRMDLRVSRLGIGGTVWGDMSTARRGGTLPATPMDPPAASRSASGAAGELAAGVNFLDTAAMYGGSIGTAGVS